MTIRQRWVVDLESEAQSTILNRDNRQKILDLFRKDSLQKDHLKVLRFIKIIYMFRA